MWEFRCCPGPEVRRLAGRATHVAPAARRVEFGGVEAAVLVAVQFGETGLHHLAHRPAQFAELDLAVDVVVQRPDHHRLHELALQVVAQVGHRLVGPAVVDPEVHHLVRGLLAPGDVALRVRVGRVVLGVVVDPGGHQLGPGLHQDRLHRVIVALPVEVVLRQAEQQGVLAVRRDHLQLDVIAAIVGVRVQRVDVRIGRDWATRGAPGRRVQREVADHGQRLMWWVFSV